MAEHDEHALTHQPLEGGIVRDAHELQELLDKPSVKIAEVVTGMLAAGRSDYILAAGRIVQAALKKNAYVQIGREIKALQEKGNIKEDYTRTKYDFKSLSELLEFVDSDAPDEDRLHAAKAMFVAVNSVTTEEGDRLVAYELLRLSRHLSASQILLLAILRHFAETTYFLKQAPKPLSPPTMTQSMSVRSISPTSSSKGSATESGAVRSSSTRVATLGATTFSRIS